MYRNFKNIRELLVFLKSKTEVLPLTLSAAVLDTVPYLLLAVQVNTPESSGKTSAMTRVHISSRGSGKIKVILLISQLERVLTE